MMSEHTIDQTNIERQTATTPSSPVPWMPMESEPGLVSVIVPAYNRATLIIETLDSVAAQTYRPIELIVVDDGSKDETRQVVQQWIDQQPDTLGFSVRLHGQPNAGAPTARNLGLTECKGEFIQYLDSDDLLHPEKLSTQIAAFNADPFLNYVYSGYADFNGKVDTRSPPKQTQPDRLDLQSFLRRAYLHTSCGLFRRDLCGLIGPWNPSLRIAQDWEYFFRMMLLEANAARVPGVYSFYRTHEGTRITDFSAGGSALAGHLIATESAESHLLARDKDSELKLDIGKRYLYLLISNFGDSNRANLRSCCHGASNHLKGTRRWLTRFLFHLIWLPHNFRMSIGNFLLAAHRHAASLNC